jgi:urease accessory protein
MLLIEAVAPAGAVAGETLLLTFDSRCKSRLRTRLTSGEEVGLFLERGRVLRGGDRLLGQDGRIVGIVAAAESLMEAQSPDPLQLARAAYHLGNRHVAVQVLPGSLRFGRDQVLGEMVRGLGLPVSEIEAPFEPEAGAYGGHGGHGHGAGGDGDSEAGHTRPKIHDHFGGIR